MHQLIFGMYKVNFVKPLIPNATLCKDGILRLSFLSFSSLSILIEPCGTLFFISPPKAVSSYKQPELNNSASYLKHFLGMFVV